MSGIDQGFLLLIDGLDWAFWSREDLATGTGAVSGISRSNNFYGLQIPQTSTAIDVKTGQLQTTSTRFQLNDVDDSLAALFASTTSDPNPPGVPYIVPGENVYDANLHGNQVGIEAVGSAGARGQYPAIASYQLGSFHLGNQFLAFEGRGQIYASVDPFIFAGRRVALYRFEKSADDWGAFDSIKRVWWGTLRDGGSVSGRKWQLSADGPDSWLRKELNQGSFKEPLLIDPITTLREDETRVGYRGRLMRYTYSDAEGFQPYQPIHCNWQNPDASTEQAAFLTYTPQQFRAWFRNTLVPEIFNNAGSPVPAGVIAEAWVRDPATAPTSKINSARSTTDEGNLSITLIEPAGVGTDWTAPPSANIAFGVGLFEIVLHEKVWKALGWSPEEQREITFEDDTGVEFTLMSPSNPVSFIPSSSSSTPQPFSDFLPGYYMGQFMSVPRPAEKNNIFGYLTANPIFLLGSSGSERDQTTRNHRPLYGGSTGVGILNGTPEADGGQVISITNFDDAVYVQPQNDAPPAKQPGGSDADPYVLGSPVTAQALFAFTGQYRAIGTEEAVERLQVGRCSWEQAGSDAVSPEARNRVQVAGTTSRLVLSRWQPPRAFNFTDKILDGDWLGLVGSGEASLRIQPIANFGSKDGITRADRALLSLLVSSGTSDGWYVDQGYGTQGYGGAQYIKPGANNKSSALSLGQFVTDRNGADFGLGIPAEMVADVFEWEALAFDVPTELRRCTIAHLGPVSGDAIARGIMAPLGWSWSLRNGKYGAFKPSDNDAEASEDAVLDEESIAGTLGRGSFLPQQNIRYRTALDAVELKFRRDPLTGEYRAEETIRSTDAGALYRTGASVMQLDAPYLTGEATVQAVRNHWNPIFKWLAKRHFYVSGLRVLQSTGLNLWPGSRVRITHPWLVSQLGAYGVTSARGIVISVAQNWAKGTTSIDLLVTQPPGQGERIAAPEASAYAYDAAGPAIYCDTDFRGIAGGHNDLTAFVKPDWASGTGDADIQVRQYARGKIVQTLTGTVTGVDPEAGRIDLDAPLTGGTWLRDCDSLITVTGFATQTATWPALTFVPIANPIGEVSGSLDNAVKWSDI